MTTKERIRTCPHCKRTDCTCARVCRCDTKSAWHLIRLIADNHGVPTECRVDALGVLQVFAGELIAELRNGKIA